MSNDRIKLLELMLREIDAERSRIVEELLSLQTAELNQPAPLAGSQASDRTPDTAEDKVALLPSK